VPKGTILGRIAQVKPGLAPHVFFQVMTVGPKPLTINPTVLLDELKNPGSTQLGSPFSSLGNPRLLNGLLLGADDPGDNGYMPDPTGAAIAGQGNGFPSYYSMINYTTFGTYTSTGQYAGPFAYRQGKPMRPDVALAFDVMQAAATAAGHPLTIDSAFRSDAEQAYLFSLHPDPKWVAPPGHSRHRLGTELDLGPTSAYGWLAANANRFDFLQRYSWEPWHYGYEPGLNGKGSGY
jgi:hypothetical protein